MFVLGQCYARKDISHALGGNQQFFLPHVHGRVVCGCFTRALHPQAPAIVLPGHGPDRERWTTVFCTQWESVPIFMKQANNAWRYVGNWKVAAWSDDPILIALHAIRARRQEDPIWRVLSLTKDDAHP